MRNCSAAIRSTPKSSCKPCDDVGVGKARVAHRRLTLTAACMAQGMMVLDVMIVNVALPAIQHELHMSPGELEWVVSAYALALAALIPLGGAVGDHLGRKRVFLAGLVVFTGASIACALSTSGLMLIGFRVLQGIGGAVMSSLTLSIISEAFPPELRSRPISLWAAVGGLGVAAGTVVGGLLLSVFPWSSIFWVNVPIGAAAFALGLIGIQESRDAAAQRFDLFGAFLSAGGLAAVTFGFIESADVSWRSPRVWTSLTIGTALLVAFVVWELRTRHPMAPPALFRTRSFTVSCSAYLLSYLSFTGFIYYVTLFFQDVKGWSPLRTGLSWLFFCVPYFAAAQMGGRVQRYLSRAATIGMGCALAGIGTAAMGQIDTMTPFGWIAVLYGLVGLGFGLMVPAASGSAMFDVPAGASGVASGIFNASRQIGTAVGLGVIGSIGVAVTLAEWGRQVALFPASLQARGASLGAEVAGGRVHTVAAALGAQSLEPARTSFSNGFEVALAVAGGAIFLGGIIAYVGLRQAADLQGGAQPRLTKSQGASLKMGSNRADPVQ